MKHIVIGYRWPSTCAWGKVSLWVQGLLIFAFSCGVHVYLAPYGVDPHHDGIMFKPALDVAEGKMIFRDTFTQYGGVTVLLQAAALKIMGPQLLALKLQTALMYGLSFTVFWRAWCRLIPPPLAGFMCLVGTLLGPDSVAEALPWSSVYAAFFQALALLLALRYMERGRGLELVLSGAAAALAFWCRQPVGVFLAAGMLCALVAIAARMAPIYRSAPSAYSTRLLFGESGLGRAVGTAALFGGGLVIVNGVIFLWLEQYDALSHWWKQSIQFASAWSETAGQGHSLRFIIDCLFPGGPHRVWLLLAVACLVLALRAGAPFLDPKAKPTDTLGAQTFLASTVAVTSWLQFYPVACAYHCYWASIPMYGVFACLFYSSHRSNSRITRSVIVLAVTGLLVYNDVKLRIDNVEHHIRSQNVPIQNPPALWGMYGSRSEVASWDALHGIIETYLEAKPDGTVVTNTGHGLFAALGTNQASYHPVYVNWAPTMLKVYPDWEEDFFKYVNDELPLVIGGASEATHVLVGKLVLWGGAYNILVPRTTHPTEFVECDGAGRCQRRPL